MQTSRQTITVLALLGTLFTVPAVRATAEIQDRRSLPAGRPAAPLQFTPVAEGDWDMSKPMVGREIECDGGKVGVFECRATNLLAYLPLDAIGGGTLSGLWGWTDSATGREFAVVGRSTGTAFVEITDPVNPRYLGDLPFHEGSEPSGWREMKVYQNHAFIVSEGPKHGMQIFDLTQLRNVTAPPVVFRETAHYNEVARTHNVAINEATGFAYLVASKPPGTTCAGGLHMADVRKPTQPIFVGCYAERLGGRNGRDRDEVHDTQCVIYQGVDTRYRGREICMNMATAQQGGLGIVDVTDKQNPKLLGVGTYPGNASAHQAWLSEDQQYLFMNDELSRRTGTLVFDVRDLEDPVLVANVLDYAIEHNAYVRGHYLYESNYQAGLCILDVSDPKNPREVGYFRSPGGESWTNFPFFTNNSDVIVFNSITQGLFIVRHRPTEGRRQSR